MSDFFTKENCCRTMFDNSVETNQYCIAIVKSEVLCEEHRTRDNQLVILLSGIGCIPMTSGNSCRVKFCANGHRTLIKRHDLLGIADEETEAYAYKLMNPFTEKEAKFLIKIIAKDYRMFEELHEYFKDDASEHLKNSLHLILAKLSSSTYQPYSKLDYNNIIGSLSSSSIVKSKALKIKEKKIDQDKDPICIFINQLYKKLYKLMEAAS